MSSFNGDVFKNAVFTILGAIFVGGCAFDMIKRQRAHRLNNPVIAEQSILDLPPPKQDSTASPLGVLMAIKNASDTIHNSQSSNESVNTNDSHKKS